MLRLDHLRWSRTDARRHRHNLADSGVAPPDLAAMGLPHTAALGAGSYAALAELEHALAARVAAPGPVIVTSGASEAIACVHGALLAAGDEVLVEPPGYEPHRGVPPLFGE